MPSQTIPALIERLSRYPYLGGTPGGLNRAQWAAMRYFAQAVGDEATATSFARAHGTTKGTASQTVLALIRKDLMSRSPMPGDGRSHCIQLTEQGRALLAGDPLDRLKSCVATLDEETQRTLMRHLQLLHTHLLSDDPQQLAAADPALLCAIDNEGQALLDGLEAGLGDDNEPARGIGSGKAHSNGHAAGSGSANGNGHADA